MTVEFIVNELTEGESYTDKDNIEAVILKCYVCQFTYTMKVIYKRKDVDKTFRDNVDYFINRYVHKNNHDSTE